MKSPCKIIRYEELDYPCSPQLFERVGARLTFRDGSRRVWSFPRSHLIGFRCRNQKHLAFRFTGGYLVKVLARDADRLLDSILKGITSVLFCGFGLEKPDDGKNPDELLRLLEKFHPGPKEFNHLVAVASITVNSPHNKRT